MKLLIADDHTIVRSGLVQILSAYFKDSEFAEARTGDEALRMTEETSWDILIIDINMPGKSGLDVIKELRTRGNNIPILVLSMNPEDQFAVGVLRGGANGYLVKESAPGELARAVECVLRGERHVSEALAAKFQIEGACQESPLALLSDRELTVARLLYQGQPIKEIAAQLNVSPKTISTYRQRVLDKLGVGSNAELVRLAVRTGLFA